MTTPNSAASQVVLWRLLIIVGTGLQLAYIWYLILTNLSSLGGEAFDVKAALAGLVGWGLFLRKERAGWMLLFGYLIYLAGSCAAALLIAGLTGQRFGPAYLLLLCIYTGLSYLIYREELKGYYGISQKTARLVFLIGAAVVAVYTLIILVGFSIL